MIGSAVAATRKALRLLLQEISRTLISGLLAAAVLAAITVGIVLGLELLPLDVVWRKAMELSGADDEVVGLLLIGLTQALITVAVTALLFWRGTRSTIRHLREAVHAILKRDSTEPPTLRTTKRKPSQPQTFVRGGASFDPR